MNMRSLSLAALTMLDVPPPEQVRIAALTGYSHVGLRLLPATPDDPDYDMLGDTPTVRETLAALRDTGIRISDVEIVRLTPDFSLDALQPFLETAGTYRSSDGLDTSRLAVICHVFCLTFGNTTRS